MSEQNTTKTVSEQEVIAMLQELPIPITITESNGEYLWDCMKRQDTAEDLFGAVREALQYLIHHPGDLG
jgi:hypothetical protein